MAKIVEIWATGYASSEGLKVIRIRDDADANVEARKRYGGFAQVHAVRDADRQPVMSTIRENAQMEYA